MSKHVEAWMRYQRSQQYQSNHGQQFQQQQRYHGQQYQHHALQYGHPGLYTGPSPSPPSESDSETGTEDQEDPYKYIYDRSTTEITFIDIPLRLLRVPLHRIPQLSRAITKLLLRSGRPPFLSMTCNELEFSVFGHVDDVEMEFMEFMGEEGRPDGEGEMSDDVWHVLQIDVNETSEGASTRVREVSEPLAAAGISILFQSSYAIDYILVKAGRIPQALAILDEYGFTLLPRDIRVQFPYDHPSPNDPPSPSSSPSPPPSIDGHSRHPRLTPSTSTSPTTTTTPTPLTFQTPDEPIPIPSHIPEPTVRLIPYEITCAGLADREDSQNDMILVAVLKLICYPELMDAGRSVRRQGRSGSRGGGAAGGAGGAGGGATGEGLIHSGRQGVTTRGVVSPRAARPISIGSLQFTPMGLGEDGGVSTDEAHIRTRTTSSRSSSVHARFDRSQPISPIVLRSPHPQSALPTSQIPTTTPTPHTRTQTSQYQHQQPPPFKPVSFFSFIRTRHKTSLITSTHILSEMFPGERGRNIIMDGGEVEGIQGFPYPDLFAATPEEEGGVEESEEAAIEADRKMPMMSSEVDGGFVGLQIDLQDFGLDTYGFVSAFSAVLSDKGIGLMYSSTYKTANLLVQKTKARQARALIRKSLREKIQNARQKDLM